MARISTAEYKRRNIMVWNEVAPRYHKKWASTNTGPFQSTQKLVELLDIRRGDCALDVACGTGVVTNSLYKKVGKRGCVVGVDTSRTALDIAKKWNRKTNLHFVNVDAEKFKFEKKFDVITCQYALFFFPNAKKALRNMKNSLKKSGKLGISVHGRRSRVPFFASIFDAVTKFIPDYMLPGTPSLDRFGTKAALRREIEDVGFSNIIVRNFVFMFSPGKFEDYWQNYLRYVAKPLKEKLDSLNKEQRIKLEKKVKRNTKPYTKQDGTIEFPWEVLILTAKNQY